MTTTEHTDDWHDIDTLVYRRSVKIFSTIKKVLGVKMKLHADNQIQIGDIFLFNHFSRFETFIPQFLIFEHTGAYSCAIAASEFFKQDTLLANYLQKVGAIPHNHHNLFPILAAQILRGRKVVIFPEGGMVKDHRVIDSEGHYTIYSRISGERRKQHTGAAVLAQGLELFKAVIRNAYNDNNHHQLQQWQEQLRFDNLDQLRLSALKPTLIIPANITFYPIRASENWLSEGVALFNKNMNFRATEELLIESNILFKNTDMDIRLGKPIDPYEASPWWAHYLLETVISEFNSINDVFALNTTPKNCKQRLLGSYFKKSANATRNQYMKAIYANVTINLSHLAATLMMYCVENGYVSLPRQHFFTTMYIAVKQLQRNTSVYLHRSLLNPLDYSELMNGSNKRFQQFIASAKNSELILEQNDSYHFLPKLLAEQDFDHIRLENLIAVYNNEAKPITAIRNTIIDALHKQHNISNKQLAVWYLEDEYRDFNWECRIYKKTIYNDINQLETANANAEPFLLIPEKSNGFGVLLIHGLLASPAELRDYGDYLANQGYTVMGVRLKGHGSSPHALHNQTWQDWYASVLRGFTILLAYCTRIFVSGFSTGGALALKLAAEHHFAIIGVSATAVPINFINHAFMLVPLLHGANTFVDWISSYPGIKPFIENESEHPYINYHNMPVKSLYELRLLIESMIGSLPDIVIPVIIVQANNDPVVDARSAKSIMLALTTTEKHLAIINSNRHGILMENIGETWAVIDTFMAQYQLPTPKPHAP